MVLELLYPPFKLKGDPTGRVFFRASRLRGAGGVTVGSLPKSKDLRKEAYHATPRYADIRVVQNSFFFLVCVANASAALLCDSHLLEGLN